MPNRTLYRGVFRPLETGKYRETMFLSLGFSFGTATKPELLAGLRPLLSL